MAELKKAIEFCLPDSQEKEHCLKDFEGKWIVLYFYPKDNTSGCTREAKEFSEKKDEFEKLGAVIIGISKDSPSSHRKFIEKHNLNILLLSDEDHKVHEAYGAWGKKKNYGKEYFGTIRSTFIIDPQLNIVKSYKNVKVKGHVDDVLETLKALINGEPEEAKEVKSEDVIKVFKETQKPLRSGDVVKALNADKKQVEKIIKQLKKEGIIESPKRCYYQLKED
nr:thioredoxin-dependent thiol peroxidase [Hippea jasoniae]